MLKPAVVVLAAVFVVPLVHMDLGMADSTSHTGARGGVGAFSVGVFYAHYRRYPLGGYVMCDAPSSGGLLHTADVFCDIFQYALPITSVLFAVALSIASNFPGTITATVKWALAATLLALALAGCIVATAPSTYKNVGAAHPEASFGVYFLVAAQLLILAAALRSLGTLF